ncbi:predicted protein [Uncinocarpus reesii 1704]|uniref:Uncharacterized protein n=1 Tax=Uncinocarpus reesii (strain UAMH 1704) TaxID=336963 RepID=C4JY73_UNCRE|nr:uncharacterized protein UREG_07124 [Uncinocarpus reesii 1704]EEP82259.1 predicted protein [Uncinocarpus reesii 1704]
MSDCTFIATSQIPHANPLLSCRLSMQIGVWLSMVEVSGGAAQSLHIRTSGLSSCSQTLDIELHNNNQSRSVRLQKAGTAQPPISRRIDIADDLGFAMSGTDYARSGPMLAGKPVSYRKETKQQHKRHQDREVGAQQGRVHTEGIVWRRRWYGFLDDDGFDGGCAFDP